MLLGNAAAQMRWLGGYQYRLCPAEKMPCTEKDFQKMPLDFVRDAHAIMWCVCTRVAPASPFRSYALRAAAPMFFSLFKPTSVSLYFV